MADGHADPAEVAALKARLATVETALVAADRRAERAEQEADRIRREAEQTRLREAGWIDALSSLPSLVFYRGEPGGRVRLFGVESARLLGLEGPVADLDRWYASIHPDDRAAYLEAERGRRTEGRAFTIDFRYTHQTTGEPRWGRERAYVTRTADGTAFHDGYILDVTEEKAREIQLQAAMDEAERASRGRAEFLATMSHELRTPLNAIIGFSQLIADQAFGPSRVDQYADYASDIHGSATHLLRLIDDILEIAKAEAQPDDLHDAVLDLDAIVRAPRKMLRQRAEAAGLTIRERHDGALPHIRGDERKLRQIILNLLTNAVKFTPSGGQVTITTSLRADGGVSIGVIDTGIGMAPDDIPRAMEPFVQLDGGLDRNFDGTGLGLPLSRNLARLHGAALRVESRLGAGTTVTLDLPPERSVWVDRPTGCA